MSDASHKSVPEWAIIKAGVMLREMNHADNCCSPVDRDDVCSCGLSDSIRVVARYIASVEEAPVDPLAEEAESLAMAWSRGEMVGTAHALALAAIRRGIELSGGRND